MNADNRSWYREPWPWLLMAGPAIVIVAGAFTTMLAIRSSDGLVADDYYKEGLMINRLLERDARARSAGISAVAQFGSAGMIRMSVAGLPGPATHSLRLRLIHPTVAGMDQTIDLRLVAPGLWEGRSAAVIQGHWRLQLDAADAGWRVVGEWSPGTTSAILRPAAAERP